MGKVGEAVQAALQFANDVGFNRGHLHGLEFLQKQAEEYQTQIGELRKLIEGKEHDRVQAEEEVDRLKQELVEANEKIQYWSYSYWQLKNESADTKGD